MRLILRLTGTWLLALALILLVIDGTKSLASDALVLTPLGETWAGLHGQSLEGLRVFLATRFFGAVLVPVLDALLSLPGFAVFAVPGIVLAVMGRTRRSRIFLREDGI